jgi:hypothetical protein
MTDATDNLSNPPANATNAGSQVGQIDPTATGSATPSVDPTAWFVAVLYFLAQSGVQIPAWVYQAISIELQANAGPSSSENHGGVLNFLTENALSNVLSSVPPGQRAASSNPGSLSSLPDTLASSFLGTQSQSSASPAVGSTTETGAGGANISATAGGAKSQSQPFVYTDPLGLNAALSSAQSYLSQLTSNEALFNSWAALLSPPLAASQTLLPTPDQNSVSNILAAAANSSTQNANAGAA